MGLLTDVCLRDRSSGMCCQLWTWLLLLELQFRQWFAPPFALASSFTLHLWLSRLDPGSEHLRLQLVLALPVKVELFIDFAFDDRCPSACALT